MRVFLLLVPLLLAACVRQRPTAEPAQRAIKTAVDVGQEEGPPARRFPDSPFLPAVAKAGLIQHEQVYVDSIDFCGLLSVDGSVYYVLYIDRYLQLGQHNQRGGSYWLVCDSAMNPVWMNPDWGGKPKRCYGNQVLVDLHDKTFEVNDDIGSCGDLITFQRENHELKASIRWSSDEVRIACKLNAEKWREDSHEPDETVVKLLNVDGHPTWRLALTQYRIPSSQGCAKIVELDSDDVSEFGVKYITCIFAEQACRPTHARTLRLPLTERVLVWIDWETRGGWEWQTFGQLAGADWTKLKVSRR